MLLSTSSRFARDAGENLLHFFNQIETENQEKELKLKITHLSNIRNRLKRRANILNQEIREETPKKSLAEINEDSQFITFERKSKKLKLEEFHDVQRNQAYQFAFGVHISNRNSKNITFDFTTNVNGVISQDVYQVTLAKYHTGMILLDTAKLPAPKSLEPTVYDFNEIRKSKISSSVMVMPLQKMADENLPKMDLFICKIKEALDGYISRFHQLANLPDVYKGKEILDIKYNFDLTEIALHISLDDNSTNEKQDTLILQISLVYKYDKSRPESLKVKVSGSGKEKIDEEAFEDLKLQCHPFYKFPLDIAIKKAFL